MAANVSVFVDTGAVRQSAGDLRNVNNSLTEKLDNIGSIMEGVQSETTFSTEASKDLVQKFKTLSSTRFPEFKEVVESYAKFLDTVAETHENIEQSQKVRVESQVEGLPTRS